MDNGYSLADIAAATGESGFGGNNSWVLILLFAMIFGGGGFGFSGNGNAARQEDIQRAVDLNSIKQGQADLGAEIQRGIYEVNSATGSAAYNNLSEIRDVQAAVADGFANQQKCCCETLRAIDSVNYNGAINTANIIANSTANTQKVLDSIAQGREQALRDRVASLELQLATASTVKYPTMTTYTNGGNPFCGCGCGNI